jgi:hypothetical protein
MLDKMATTVGGVLGGNNLAIQTNVDPLFLNISKKQANFLIWRVEASYFINLIG